jgi:hypothetical protein
LWTLHNRRLPDAAARDAVAIELRLEFESKIRDIARFAGSRERT